MPHPVTKETATLAGDEIRRLRTSRGWTRQDLARALAVQLGVDVSLQTLATYELGTRNMTLPRFAELCYVLGTPMTAVVAKVDERTSSPAARPDVLEVDLRVIAATERADLGPARAWAQTKLIRGKGAPKVDEVVNLTGPALGLLAQLCDLEQTDIVAALRDA